MAGNKSAEVIFLPRLGLPIARHLAEDMDGRVGLDAEPEETCFFVDRVPWRESV